MRTPKPWFRSANQTWYVCLDGKQHNLGKNEKKAHDKFKALMNRGITGDHTVRQVLQAYWKWAKKNLAESTCKRRQPMLQSFSKAIPAPLKAEQLRALHVQKWIDANDTKKVPVKGKGNKGKRQSSETPISPTTASDYIALVKGVMSWAKGMGYVDHNPIADMPKPARRVREFFIPVELWPKVFEAATDQEFKDYLGFMVATGARAEEIVRFELQHLNGSRFILPVTQSKGRKKARVVYVPDDAMEIVNRLAKQWPEGKLFRNSEGNPWNRDSINCRFRRLKTVLKMPQICATVLRHSFAHHRLTSGQDALTVSKLCGHVDTRMLATRYGHLDANVDFMSGAANQIPSLGLTGIAPSPLA
ncbi:tyrosine-type recombinase/integrase [Lacipirellula sp.]|uniref:tyrosine-type recombinase/integrase n=1 Tax=Lacipirellula sp. TaxID=2691419 RepID=UPI003D0B8897